jgi:tyrosyl-tRNA synthetase
MSISDELMWRYIELLSFAPLAVVRSWKEQLNAGGNPRDVKVAFAQEIVERFHGREAARAALADFEARFRNGALPQDIPEVTLRSAGEGIALPQVLKQSGLVASTSEAMRMIEQGGVKLGGNKASDKSLRLPSGTEAVLQVGKRKYARVRII